MVCSYGKLLMNHDHSLTVSSHRQDPTAANMEECMEYVVRAETQAGGVFAHQSEHASFQIVTPKAVLRLTHGR